MNTRGESAGPDCRENWLTKSSKAIMRSIVQCIVHNNHTRLSIRGIQTQILLCILANTQLIVECAHMVSMYESGCETKKSNRKGEEIKGIVAKTGNMDAGNANKVFFCLMAQYGFCCLRNTLIRSQ